MINLRIQSPEPKQNVLTPRITVVGIGGAGGNAINNMIASGLDGVEFLVCNTDAQALAGSRAQNKIQLGTTVTGGLGAGAKPEIGRAAAEESLDDLMQYIDGSNMVFITSGMGGGTGTGAAPVLARACKDAGILTVGVVTKPFHFEGTMRMKAAEAGIQEMQQYVDTLIVIPNQNLFRIANEKTTFADAFKLADSVLQSAVRGVTDLMVMPGLVNLDFNDIKTTMTEMGKAMMGTGSATGDRRATMASEAAINNPLLDDVTMKGAKGVIINIAGGHDMTLFEIDEACNRIREEVDPDANIIFGTSVDDSLEGALRVTVLATGIETAAEKKARQDDTRHKRFDAARPPVQQQTQAGSAAGAAPRAAALQQQPTGGLKTYAGVAAQTEAAAVAPALHPAAAPMAPAAAVAPSYVQDQAFIPPQPVDPTFAAHSEETVPYSRIVAGVAAPKAVDDSFYEAAPEPGIYAPQQVAAPVQQQPVYQQQPMPPQAYAPAPVADADLAIPAGIVPAAPMYQQQRRAAQYQMAPAAEPTLSLFQRITNRVRRTVEATFDDGDAMMDQQPTPTYVARGGAQAAVTSQPIPAAAQAPVEVARPAKAASPQAELDLDIPAFLRRQAS